MSQVTHHTLETHKRKPTYLKLNGRSQWKNSLGVLVLEAPLDGRHAVNPLQAHVHQVAHSFTQSGGLSVLCELPQAH